MVKVPERLDVPVFAATVNPTVPGPFPLDPLVIAIQLRLVDAVQAQPAPALTLLVPVPPADENDWLVGLIVYEQLAAA
jgi:hypothetical protein